jgi:hypothetical protein
MCAKGRRMEVWIRMLGSIPYLSSPASGSPSGATLYAHTARSSYPGADKGAQVLPISRHWTAEWWCSGTETECPSHPICAAPRRFGNRGHDCLGPCNFCCMASHRFGDHDHDCLGLRDFCCVVMTHGELRRAMVSPGAPNIATSRVNRGSPHVNHSAPPFQNPNVQDSKRLHGKGCWPHPWVRSLFRGGSKSHCRYPEDRVPPRTSSKSKQKTSRARVPACPKAPAPTSRQLQGRRVSPQLRLPPPDSWQLWGHHVPLWLWLLPPSSGRL